MTEMRLLTAEELRINHLQKTTDFAYLTGAWQTEKPQEKYQSSSLSFYDSEADRCDSPRFSSTVNGCGWVCSFYPDGEDWAVPGEKDMTFPLAMPGCRVIPNNVVLLNRHTIPVREDDRGNKFFLYGAYPQTVATKEEADHLDGLFKNKILKRTKNKYTYFVEDSTLDRFSSRPKKIVEYELGDQRYVRISPDKLHFLHYSFTLSNNEKMQQWKSYWVKVEPLKWQIESPGWQRDSFFNADAHLSIAPISGISYDNIPAFLQNFNREITQSHDFCINALSHVEPRKIATNKGHVPAFDPERTKE